MENNEINNLKLILKLLSFPDEDTFYHLQIIKRRKENPGINSNSKIIKTYYIYSKDYLINKMDEIKNLCKFSNARAYINLNPRSFERTSYHLLKKVTDCILNKDFKSVRKSYETVCGQYGKTTSWIIDVDIKDFEKVLNIATEINKCNSKFDPNIIAYIPTINGYHIISHPFDTRSLDTVKERYTFDIQKNNPTLLYYDLSSNNNSINIHLGN